MSSTIRLADEGCAEAIRAIYAPIVENTAISFETVPPDVAEMVRRMRVTLETHPWLVCEGQRGVEGYAYGSIYRVRSAYNWSCEVSVYVASDFRGTGVGGRLYTALFELLRRQGYCQAYAGITLPNPASVGLHEALGFEAVGIYKNVGFKFDAWHDVGWWQRRLCSEDAAPKLVLVPQEVCGAVDWSIF